MPTDDSGAGSDRSKWRVGFASRSADPLARVTRKLTNVGARLEELWSRRKMKKRCP
jgi:hypothetical protein